MAASALASEQPCFQHQPTGQQAVMKVQQQIEIPTAAVSQFKGVCMIKIFHQLQKRLLF
jgi:hypothetical protein